MQLKPFLNDHYKDILAFYNHPSIKSLPLSYGRKTIDLAQHVEIDNTVEQLSLKHFTFHLDDDIFELSDDIRSLTEPIFSKKRKILTFSNDKNVRLKKIERVGAVYYLHTQPVFYEAHLRTNMAMDFPLAGKRTLRELVHPNGEIELLENSLLANQLGINILIFTKDGDLILTKRSEKVNYAAGKIAPSVSGSLSLSDVTDGMIFTKEMIFREGVEELGLKPVDIEPGSIIFLGLVRELLRGGKPDFYFTLRISKTFKEVIDCWKEAVDYMENERLIRIPFKKFAFEPLVTRVDLDRFDEKVYHLLQRFYKNMSLSLLAHLSLWIKYKRNNVGKEEMLA